MKSKKKDDGIQLYPELIVPVEDPKVEELDERVMCFDKLEFLPRLNITVRKGTKWADTFGPLKAVKSGENEKYVHIDVIDTVVMPFSDLNTYGPMHGLLQFEHDPAIHGSPSSLFQMMQRLYPPTTPTTADNFKWGDEVTVVFFRVDPTHMAPGAW